jgi:hypothetical protein
VYFFFSIYKKYITNIVKSDNIENKSIKKTILDGKSDDVFASLKQNEEMKSIVDTVKKGDTSSAKNELENLSKNTSSQVERETIELYTASILMESNKDEGINYYKNIYNNIKNSKVNRAYALLKVDQYSRGEKKPEYLENFLTEEENKKSSKEKYNIISNKIYQLYPFAISAARIGKYELSQNPSKETAQKIYNLYNKSLEEGTKEMLQYEGLRHLAGNTGLNHAQLWAEMEKHNIVNQKETQKIFESAYENARLYSPRGTLEFIVLAYADYNSERKNYSKTEKLIEFLTEQALDKNVVNALKLAIKDGSYPNLQKYYYETKKFPNFFTQFNW